MPLVYAAVFRDAKMVAGTFAATVDTCAKWATNAQKVVGTVVALDQYKRQTVEDRDVSYSYLCNGMGLVLIVVSTKSMRMRTIFGFLEAVEAEFRDNNKSDDDEPPELLLLSKLLIFEDDANDKMAQLVKALDEARGHHMVNLGRAVQALDAK